MADEQKNGGLVGSVTGWLKSPFNTRGSALNWILFVGLLIVAIWFWQVILLELQREL